MNCREFHTAITAAVDHCLSRDDETRFQKHAQQCAPCRAEYENEHLTKLLIRNRVRLVQAPPALCGSIAERLRDEDRDAALSSPVSSSRHRRTLALGGWVALGVASALAVLVVFRLWPGQDRAQDDLRVEVIGHSLENYQAMLTGAIRPQVVSDRPDRVRAFFDGKTEFPVTVPSLRECTLIGGVLNESGGVTLAYVVYRHGDKLLCVYQACWETVQRGERLQLADRARQELVRTGWFTEAQPGGHTIALWTEGRTLCAAVSSMTGDELRDCLSALRVPPEGSGTR